EAPVTRKSDFWYERGLSRRSALRIGALGGASAAFVAACGGSVNALGWAARGPPEARPGQRAAVPPLSGRRRRRNNGASPGSLLPVAGYRRSMIVAVPIPPPVHIAISAVLLFWRSSSSRAVWMSM